MAIRLRRVGAVEKSQERLRLFPGWWVYQGARGSERPLYRVVVRNELERKMAQQIKPRCVRAEIVVEPGGFEAFADARGLGKAVGQPGSNAT
ncbi:MAG: hypothetical protein QOD71_432 [Thermoleophilaceae bacterium]|nr:hypothetical protein [Thermoleophilaceae bacterium]